MGVCVVTGGTGFVGARLCARLARRGEEVHALARRAPAERASGVAFHQVDLADARRSVALVRALAPERVYHLAALAHPLACAQRPAEAFRTNVGGTAAVCAALEGSAARVLVASSAHVYGAQPDGPIDEGATLAPSGAYARSKRCAEDVARAFAARGLWLVIARPFNHSAAGQEASFVLPALVGEVRRAAREGRVARTGNLWPRRDFLHVECVLDAYALLLERGECGAAYNVCRGETVAIGALLEGLQRRLGAALCAERDPERVRAGEPLEVAGNPARLRALGWSPRISVDGLLDELVG